MKRTSNILFALVLVLSLVLIIAGPMASPVQATEKDTGPTNGSAAEDDDSIGTETWDFVNKALVQNDEYAEVLLQESSNTSHYLKVTDFDFDIPDTAEIAGIEVEVDRYESATPLRVWDNAIRIVKDGTIGGDNKALPSTSKWPDSDTDTYVSYGSSTELWGLNWTPEDINNSGFGVAISAVLDGSSARIARVDHVRITIHYSIDEYYLTMAASPEIGGDAIDKTDTEPYYEGEVVDIEAVPATGYLFDGWTADPSEASAGFANANDAETTFTMPAYNVTVTANFQVPGPLEPPTVTTVGYSGVTRYSASLRMDYTLGDYPEVWLYFAYRESGTDDWHFTGELRKIPGGTGTYTYVLTELTASTEYDFQARLRYDSSRIENADILQFTTDTLPSGCFIATAAYGTPTAEQIDVLREFRDVVLLESTAGSQFVALYYQFSPPVADFIAGNEFLRTLVREFLVDPIVWVVEVTGDSWRN